MPSRSRSCCSSGATGGLTARCWGESTRSRAGTTWGRYPDAKQLPGVVVYRWEAPLFFANASAFRQQIRHLVRERHPNWIVLQCEAVTDVDVTAAEMLEQLDNELNAAGIHMAFAELRSRLQDLTLRYGLLETLDRDHFYPRSRPRSRRSRRSTSPRVPAQPSGGDHSIRVMYRRFAGAKLSPAEPSRGR